jgi:hypothetical protein
MDIVQEHRDTKTIPAKILADEQSKTRLAAYFSVWLSILAIRERNS